MKNNVKLNSKENKMKKEKTKLKYDLLLPKSADDFIKDKLNYNFSIKSKMKIPRVISFFAGGYLDFFKPLSEGKDFNDKTKYALKILRGDDKKDIITAVKLELKQEFKVISYSRLSDHRISDTKIIENEHLITFVRFLDGREPSYIFRHKSFTDSMFFETGYTSFAISKKELHSYFAKINKTYATLQSDKVLIANSYESDKLRIYLTKRYDALTIKFRKRNKRHPKETNEAHNERIHSYVRNTLARDKNAKRYAELANHFANEIKNKNIEITKVKKPN